jgi:hypothetical protein
MFLGTSTHKILVDNDTQSRSYADVMSGIQRSIEVDFLETTRTDGKKTVSMVISKEDVVKCTVHVWAMLHADLSQNRINQVD